MTNTTTPICTVPGIPSTDERAMVQHLVPVLTIWREARGEGKTGMLAVAFVIHKRMQRRKMSARRVCLEPFQFSCWNAIQNPERNLFPDEEEGPGNYPSFWVAYFCWLEVLNGAAEDPTEGADFYFNPKAAKPSWGREFTFIKRIGDHDFYRSY